MKILIYTITLFMAFVISTPSFAYMCMILRENTQIAGVSTTIKHQKCYTAMPTADRRPYEAVAVCNPNTLVRNDPTMKYKYFEADFSPLPDLKAITSYGCPAASKAVLTCVYGDTIQSAASNQNRLTCEIGGIKR